MNKNVFFKIAVALCFVAVAVVWLLSVMEIIAVPLSWVIAVFAFVLGLLFIGKGLVENNVGFFKRLNIIFGGALIIAGIVALVGTVIQDNLVLPIIAIVITLTVVLGIIATGGKKWDDGDNDKAGYKNYYERKKEEEKNQRR